MAHVEEKTGWVTELVVARKVAGKEQQQKMVAAEKK